MKNINIKKILFKSKVYWKFFSLKLKKNLIKLNIFLRQFVFYRFITIKLKYYKRYIITNKNLFIRRIKLKWKFQKKRYIIMYGSILLILILGGLAATNKIKIIDRSTHKLYFADTVNTLESFMLQLRQIESGDDYTARRSQYVIFRTSHGMDTGLAYSQYIGFYQLGKSARKEIGFSKISEHDYWNSPELQHKSAILWFIFLKVTLKDEIEKYNNKWFGSFYITESGLIAMSHLVGPTTVKNWLKNPQNANIQHSYQLCDGNGKKGVDYLQQLGRYNLNLDRFINDDLTINEDEIDKFVENIIQNKDIKQTIISTIDTKNNYIILDSNPYVEDTIKLKLKF